MNADTPTSQQENGDTQIQTDLKHTHISESERFTAPPSGLKIPLHSGSLTLARVYFTVM